MKQLIGLFSWLGLTILIAINCDSRLTIKPKQVLQALLKSEKKHRMNEFFCGGQRNFLRNLIRSKAHRSKGGKTIYC